ncbi:MAG: hypothetical protein WBY93_10590 [Candidatus Binatus sp.]
MRTDSGHRRKLRIVVLAIVLAPMVAALTVASALAQANPPSIGSVDDYMHQDNDGPSAGVPPQAQGYGSPQGYGPPQGYGSPGVASQEWNNQYADPNAARTALIGAAVVGAVALGMWAYQQHEMHQAQRRARKRLYTERPAYPN